MFAHLFVLLFGGLIDFGAQAAPRSSGVRPLQWQGGALACAWWRQRDTHDVFAYNRLAAKTPTQDMSDNVSQIPYVTRFPLIVMFLCF
jgi:hypothetical protein